MVLDVMLDKETLTTNITDPFQADINTLVSRINIFARARGADISGLHIDKLIPKMIKGIAGCEHGCPADAKGMVSRGFKEFDLKYIEGGILSAETLLSNGSKLALKMFPDC